MDKLDKGLRYLIHRFDVTASCERLQIGRKQTISFRLGTVPKPPPEPSSALYVDVTNRQD